MQISANFSDALDRHPNLRKVLIGFHLAVLVGALWLVVLLTIDTVRNISLLSSDLYLKFQLWVCILMMLDILLECFLSARPGRQLWKHAIFMLIAIPWLNILDVMHVTLDDRVSYLLRILPVLRAAYILGVVAIAVSKNRMTGVLTSYIGFMILVAYFGAMLFFVEEHGVNPDIKSLPQALWWAWMTMTTAGCYINEYTVIGKILETVLSACGIMFFPVFTVYVTDAIGATKKLHIAKNNTKNG